MKKLLVYTAGILAVLLLLGIGAASAVLLMRLDSRKAEPEPEVVAAGRLTSGRLPADAVSRVSLSAPQLRTVPEPEAPVVAIQHEKPEPTQVYSPSPPHLAPPPSSRPRHGSPLLMKNMITRAGQKD